MTPQRWERLQLLIEDALGRPERLRRDFVESACGDDSELRDLALSLLDAGARTPEEPEPPAAWWELVASLEAPLFVAGEQIARRYRVSELLGRGGMGEVYEAWDEELAIPVALKALHLPGRTEDAYRRLKLEGLLARAVWHPNVCRLYELGKHEAGKETVWFLAMELLQGPTLADEIGRTGRLPFERAGALAAQLAAGLEAAHQLGIVHRDFKPGNVMLVTRDGREQAVVTDFGIARMVSRGSEPTVAERADATRIEGTPAYMAPELLRGEEAGPAADVYALGIVLHEMVTGEIPFVRDSNPVAGSDPPAPAVSSLSVSKDLDARWREVVLRCLEQDPRRRYARAAEVADALAGRLPVVHPRSLDPAMVPPSLLPAEPDLFLGREQELEALARQIRAAGARLVTLVGAGGMGKSRLAIHFARERLELWPGGVWFCDLTEARSAEGIVPVVAGALGVQVGRDPLRQLGHAIAGRGRCLLILDNCEQIAGATAGTISQWMARAAEAQFLVTSRQKLGLGEQEQTILVGPLTLESGAELLATRARRLRPGLDLEGAEASAVSEIVRLVDGMPLAIELAGARMRVMSAAQVLAQMRKRFSLLAGGARARHETLSAAIDASWELLRPWEQSVWSQCSVFEGGFTMEAAEAVVELRGWEDAPSVIDVVQSLVDQSLLRMSVQEARSGKPTARFGMFVSLHEYARLKLNEDADGTRLRAGTPAAEATERRHGKWFSRYGGIETTSARRLPDQPPELRPSATDLDNLIAACRRGLHRGEPDVVVATYRATWATLESWGPFGIAVEMGREALRSLELGRAERGQILHTLGQAEWYSGLATDASAHLEDALGIARTESDRRLEAAILGSLGGMQVNQGRMDEGSVHLERALELARSVADRKMECVALNTLSMVRRGQGRMTEATAESELALAVARSSGNRRMEGIVLANLGLLQQDLGHTDQARTCYEGALTIHREVRHRRFEGNVQDNLGGLAFDQGRFEEAGIHLESALSIHREIGARFSEAISLTNLGFLAQSQRQVALASDRFEVALAIAREVGDRRLEGRVTAALATVHQERGDLESARSLYESALEIHRSADDRRSQGDTLSYFAGLLLRLGDLEGARDALAVGESLLRQVDAHLELGQLLCVRAELERVCGRVAVAQVAFQEAEALAKRLGSGPSSDLGRSVADLRRSLMAGES